ncbi:MAG: hypothetical protein HKM90_03025 [Desulfobacteraceae bacterium]|nr:hypothetical protein [Desulfobacteraceae bacterium]
MGTCSFQIRNETFFCKVKGIKGCAETYIWYVAQGIPLIDADLPAVWQAGIAEKGPFLDGN